jgi:steroid Delta-isomerase
MSTRFSDIANWFETLTPESLERVGEMYAQDALFIDPFNQLEGLTSVRAVYQHMFDTLKQPRFVVTTSVERECDGFMTWDFLFECRGQAQQISGCTQFKLNDQGLIVLHRDYWDAAQQVYEKIPMLGSVVRMIRRKLSLPTTS